MTVIAEYIDAITDDGGVSRIDWAWIEFRLGPRVVNDVSFWQDRRDAQFEEWMDTYIKPLWYYNMLEAQNSARNPPMVFNAGYGAITMPSYYEPSTSVNWTLNPPPIKVDFFTQKKGYGVDWQTNFQYDRDEALNEIFEDLAMGRHPNVELTPESTSITSAGSRTQVWIEDPANDDERSDLVNEIRRLRFADDLSHLSDRVLTSFVYLCILFGAERIINLGEGNTLSNLFYRVSRTDGTISTTGYRPNQLSVPGQDEFFNDSHIGNCIRIAPDLTVGPVTETRVFHVRNHVGWLGDDVPNGTNYDFEMYKSKFQIANSLTDGFTNENLQPDDNNLVDALQECAIYINESEYDVHTILWSRARPTDVNCGMFLINCDDDLNIDPVLVEQATATIPSSTADGAGNYPLTEYQYTTRMIALQDNHYRSPSEDDPNNAEETGATPQDRLDAATLTVRLHYAVHSTGRKTVEVGGNEYTFIWTDYLGFAWILSKVGGVEDTSTIIDTDSDGNDIAGNAPPDFLPALLPLAQVRTLTGGTGVVNGFMTAASNGTRNGISYSKMMPGWTNNRNAGDVIEHFGAGQPAEDGPSAITWHWTAGWNVYGNSESSTASLGPDSNAGRAVASAHYSVGRSFDRVTHEYERTVSVGSKRESRREGTVQLVSLDDRSGHAGGGRSPRYVNGAMYDDSTHQGRRSSVGIEVTYIADDGHTRTSALRHNTTYFDPWVEVTPHTSGRNNHRTLPTWSLEQIAMCINVGSEILERWDVEILGPRQHHGHHDINPFKKYDPIGFPFARVLRALYPDQIIPDVWGIFWGSWSSRARAIENLGYTDAVTNNRESVWRNGSTNDVQLSAFKTDRNAVRTTVNSNAAGAHLANTGHALRVDTMGPVWCTFTCWEIHDARLSGWSRPGN